MLILYDPQTFLRQRAGGISRYFVDLISYFDLHPELETAVQCSYPITPNVHAFAALPKRFPRLLPRFVPRAIAYAPAWLAARSMSSSADIVHHTYYSKRFLNPLRAGQRRVVTIYDMIPEKESPDLVSGSHLAKRDYVEAADLVISISESTKQDLIQIFRTDSRKITVIPLAVGDSFRPGQLPLPGLPRDYLLYVGGRSGYKRFDVLIQAMVVLNTLRFPIKCVVVGRPPNKIELGLINQLRVGALFQFVHLSDIDLARAYSNARALIQTSQHEGFGLPVLEAMASGVPVIAVAATAVPEVGGDVAQYFEPGNVDQLVELVLKTVQDDDHALDLRLRGIQRAQKFSIAKMAQRTRQEYERLLS